MAAVMIAALVLDILPLPLMVVALLTAAIALAAVDRRRSPGTDGRHGLPLQFVVLAMLSASHRADIATGHGHDGLLLIATLAASVLVIDSAVSAARRDHGMRHHAAMASSGVLMLAAHLS